MINIKGLNKIYNKGKSNQIHVINNTNLELPSTGLISFLGASGSGKTTLLNVIGGLDSAKGDITYDDAEFIDYKMSKIDNYRRKNIGYIFQNYNLLPNISVYDNLTISLNLIGITAEEEINKRIEYCLSAVKMSKYKKRLASALSGGQQQRISIARALVKNSKIIIADEPTGNLDSANTIEVMNILRKISETKLVLLVTHDRNIANFYSDKIIEIKDGSIISEKGNEIAFQSLDTRNTNTIYLKDLQKEDGSFKNINMTIYHEGDSIQNDLDLVLVYKNGNIYIDAKQKNVKLVGANTEIKLLDEKYKQLEKSMISNYNFDLSNFSDEKTGKRFNFKTSLLKIKTALANFFGVRIRTKLLYFGLFFIGCLIAVSVINFGTTSYINEDSLYYDKDAYAVYDKDDNYNYKINEEFSRKISDIISRDENIIDITNVYQQRAYLNLDLKVNASISSSVYLSVDVLILATNLIEESDLYNNLGTIKAKENEIVIDKIVADRLIKAADKFIKLEYNDLLGLKFDHQYTIVGITNRQSNSVYTNRKTLGNFKGGYYNDIIINDSSLFYKNRAEYDEGYFSYKVVYGSGFKDSSQNQILVNLDIINQNIINSIGIIGSTITLATDKEDMIFNVVGYFESTETNADFITNRKEVRYSDDTYFKGMFTPDNMATAYDYKLITGQLPVANNEAMLSIYSGYKIGDKVQDTYGREYKITGLYFAADGNESLLISSKNYLSMFVDRFLDDRKSILIFSSDIEKTIQIFAEEGIVLQSSYTALKAERLSNLRQEKNFLLIMSFSLISIVIIYVFFMMRAKMISKIYDIGVYRALGATKGKIYSIFFVELLVQTTLTTLLGYIITILLAISFGKALSDLGELFHVNALYSILGVAFLYACNIIFGLLPITLLLRKTPSEIIAKYDI